MSIKKYQIIINYILFNIIRLVIINNTIFTIRIAYTIICQIIHENKLFMTVNFITSQ
jgi:hypothetical protein